MLKQIGVRLDENLIKELKQTALNQGLSMQVLISEAITSYNDNMITKEETLPEPTYEKPKDQLDDLYYVFPKTFKVGPKAKQDMEKSTGGIRWALMQDCKPHFDSKGNIIPFRYTDENGIVIEPDEEELSYMSDVLGKAIRMED